ncbi:MAG TPA: hypothetical protein VM554_11065 [Acidisarcina sp.]|nr:hypothetical protein [Acidisarcina sp.]
MLITKASLISQLVPPLDAQLGTELIDEFVSLERRYIQREWEPTQLDGGQFCELLGRIIYHLDSGNLNRGKEFEECEKYVKNEQVPHSLNRRDALHLMMVLRTAYKFRSQRGAVHISPTYKPNHMDSKFVVDAVRWAFAEALRMFWSGDREKVASAIRELLQFDVPAIGRFEDNLIIVQRTDLAAEEEILVMLHYAGESGFSRRELGKYVKHPASTITRAIDKLESSAIREIVQLPSTGNYRMTDLGSKRIREKLADKLLTM